MEILEQTDQEAFLWLNGWVGHFPWLDALARLAVSDYLAPMVLSLALLGLWFTGATEARRERNQRGVMAAAMALGLASLVVEVLNNFLVRPRPFATLKVSLLFYQPVDSSFPANPAAIGFAVATAVWLWDRRVGTVLLIIAALYSLSRVYAGVQYPLDILGGWAIGIGAGVIATLVIRHFKPLPRLILRLARTLYLA
ncbi:MAG: phosphatase PAP2 family protein [Chloroflexi bacterium]|nr:phosphatase PAP2 family protein [Chloroflexota bacterium]MBI4197678.1 phosphatase PAP2 family protein [Chloroflexota bacterium]